MSLILIIIYNLRVSAIQNHDHILSAYVAIGFISLEVPPWSLLQLLSRSCSLYKYMVQFMVTAD